MYHHVLTSCQQTDHNNEVTWLDVRLRLPEAVGPIIFLTPSSFIAKRFALYGIMGRYGVILLSRGKLSSSFKCGKGNNIACLTEWRFNTDFS